MNYKPTNTNNFIDLSLFKTPDDAEKFLLETRIEVEDINNQIKDFVELLDVSKKINTELDVDPDWIVKAQYARRIKLNHIYTVEQWLTNQVDNKGSNKLAMRVSLLEQQTTSLQKRLDKERQSRANAIEVHHKQIGFTFRAIRELYSLIMVLLTKLELNTPTLLSQEQLSWVDEVITTNPKALLLHEDA